jgi:hypothetical protein
MVNFKRKSKENNYARLERLLKTIAYHPNTWSNRKELTREEFLKVIYDRFKSTLTASVQEIMKTAFFGKRLEIKTLDEWLVDDGFDDQTMFKLKASLEKMISHYTNIRNSVGMRQLIKHMDNEKDYVFLIYDVPPELKGVGEVIYVYLERESYDFINKMLKEGRNNSESLYL